MQIDAVKFKPLTEAEKLRRRTNNMCLYCGNPGHIARQCPQKLVKLQVQAVEIIYLFIFQFCDVAKVVIINKKISQKYIRNMK
jgi:hypothetical protein